MPPKTKRIVDFLGNRDGGDTSNRQAQDKRATVADPIVPRQEPPQDDRSLHEETQGSSTHSRNSNLNEIEEDVHEQPNIMELMHTLVGVVDKQQRIQESWLGPRSGLTEFVKLVKPFDGSSTDPIKAEEWIEEIEKAYRA